MQVATLANFLGQVKPISRLMSFIAFSLDANTVCMFDARSFLIYVGRSHARAFKNASK